MVTFLISLPKSSKVEEFKVSVRHYGRLTKNPLSPSRHTLYHFLSLFMIYVICTVSLMINGKKPGTNPENKCYGGQMPKLNYK